MIQVLILITGYIHLGAVNSWKLSKKFTLLSIYRCMSWRNKLNLCFFGRTISEVQTHTSN